MSLKTILLTSLLTMSPNVENDMADSLRVRGISEQSIENFIQHNEFEIDPRVERLFNVNPEKESSRGRMTYEEYRENLGLDSLIKKMPDYVNKYEEDLLEAQRIYGVDHRYIAAIKGIESSFGTNIGFFNLVNSLYSQFNMENRRKFASDQLAALIRFSEKNNISMEKLSKKKSSYAGAIGQGQFLPTSLEVKFLQVEDDELFTNRNFIFSIANYLANNRGSHPETGVSFSWIPELNNQKISVRVGNYYAIWGYNRNVNYVRAVDELANTIEYVEVE